MSLLLVALFILPFPLHRELGSIPSAGTNERLSSHSHLSQSAIHCRKQTMLGSFWTSRRDTSSHGGGDTTPKAPIHSNPDRERNPFEASLSSNPSSSAASNSSSSGRHSRKNSATNLGNSRSNNTVDGSSGSSTCRAYPIPAVNAPASSSSNLNASTTRLSSSTNSSNGSGSSSIGHGHHHSHHGHHGLPAGLRTPTLQKSFVLPEVTSSVNATGLHAPNTSSKTAAAALHQSPMYPNNSSSSSSAGVNSGRNTPTRTAHSHTNTAPYPNPKDHPSSPKSSSSKQKPDFKLSQPPDSKNNSGKANSNMITNAPKTPVNEAFPSSSSSSSSANTSTPSTQADSSSSSSTSHDAKQQALASSNYSSGNAAASTNGATTARRRGDHGSSSLKGKLTVKIIEARNLVTPEANIRPYVVATFEQNEFVSIEAINDREGDDGDIESSSPNGADTAQNGKSDSGIIENTGKASAYNPIWKHEVAL